eukprot:11542306-Ditylum_brightwellii.AAC.2
MGIDNYTEVVTNDAAVTPVLRARYRAQFFTELFYVVESMRIHVLGIQNTGSQNPDYIFVWKVPKVDKGQHAELVAKAINNCNKIIPKQVNAEAVRHFNVIMSGVTAIPYMACNAIQDYLLIEDTNPNGTMNDKYVGFVLSLTAGHLVDDFVLADGRANNS